MSVDLQVESSGPTKPLLFVDRLGIKTGKMFIDSDELSETLNLPVSWVREQTRSRCADPIPHFRLGKYVRFNWNSAELQAWISRRLVSTAGEKKRCNGQRVVQ